jgi:hypothetical protein
MFGKNGRFFEKNLISAGKPGKNHFFLRIQILNFEQNQSRQITVFTKYLELFGWLLSEHLCPISSPNNFYYDLHNLCPAGSRADFSSAFWAA